MDPFCKCISKILLSGKAPLHEVNTFTYVKGLIYKHAMDSNQRFLALVIPISWYFTVHIEAHDRLGHQTVNRTYHLVKCQHYWRGMNEDIHKSTNNCALCKRENTGISPSNNWYTWQTVWKNSHRPGFRSQCLCIRKSTYTDCHWSPNRMARGFLHPW